jgi:hypothetical protein
VYPVRTGGSVSKHTTHIRQAVVKKGNAMMALTARMEQMLAEAPPLTERQRDLIAACFSGVELGVDEAAEDRPSSNSTEAG